MSFSVLVVDDEQETCDLLEMSLIENGYDPRYQGLPVTPCNDLFDEDAVEDDDDVP